MEARFSVGLSVVLGASPDDLASLCELFAGVRPTRSGSVTLGGDDVGTRPSARRRVLSLFREEELFARRTVSEALSEICALRGSPAAVEEWLSDAGLPDLGRRAPERLLPGERRAAALSLALGADGAALLALYEPLLLLPRVSERFVIERCRSRAEHAVVVVFTTSLEHALRFGGSLYWLERGRLQGPSQTAARVVPGFTLRVQSSSARELAEALAQDPDVSSVGFEPRRSASELWVRGADPERLAACVCRHARSLGAAIDGLRPALPTLESVLLSRAGWTDPSYHLAPGAVP